MKPRSSCPRDLMIAVALSTIAAATATAQARDTVRIDMESGSRVWIEGSSNVHNWSCRATSFDARVEVDPAADTTQQIRRVVVKLSARDLKCGNRRMDNDLYAALKATDPATPSFIVGIFDPQGAGAAGPIDARGTLLLAGVERDVTARITIDRLADGTVKATGSVPLKMTDFGVKPPVGLFGLIRSRNEVTVHFELIVNRRSSVP